MAVVTAPVAPCKTDIIIPYPTVMTHTKASNDAGTPLDINVATSKYLLPFLSVKEIAVTLGNPDEARPIPQDANKEQPNTNVGAAFGLDKLLPTCSTKGTIIIALTVWETNVPTTNIKIPKIHRIANRPSF